MRLERFLLALSVGLNLTLICQGHHSDNHDSGPHVALLGELHEEADRGGEGTAAAASEWWGDPCAAVTGQAPTSHVYLAPSLFQAYALAPAYGTTQEIEGASGLDSLLLPGPGLDLRLQATALSRQEPHTSRPAPGPEPPPPRCFVHDSLT
jgi:hypothetical protein